MLHHKFFTRGVAITSLTILSTGRRVTLSLLVCFLNTNSDTSVILMTHELGVQSPPLDKEAIYGFASVSSRIDDIKPCISLLRGVLHLELFLLFWYKDRTTQPAR